MSERAVDRPDEHAPRILIVDEATDESDVLASVLTSCGYSVATAQTADEGLARLAAPAIPSVVLIGVDAEGVDGYALCRRIRESERTAFVPVVMITAKRDQQRLKAIQAGADDFIAKPFDWVELLARLRSLARLGAYHEQVESQAEQLADWTRSLAVRLTDEFESRKRLEQLRRFLSPQLAEVVAGGSERLLESHRREITAVFCDIRGFTAFSEIAEPEEVMAVLRDYHATLGAEVFRFGATLERFAGDAIFAFFNDPVPCDDGTAQAVRMALAMRDRVDALTDGWRRRGHDLGFGVGITLGYATMGRIGFEQRWDYGAVGSVVNLAARLCGEALTRQILLSERAYAAVEALVDAESVGRARLKGFREPVAMYNVIGMRDGATPADPGTSAGRR